MTSAIAPDHECLILDACCTINLAAISHDEVPMYAREKVGTDPVWKDRLANFFQYLTQAAGKTDRCAIVASLLATDPAKSDELGRAILQDLQVVFLREREEGVQPVGKGDVAEVLRRRFFTITFTMSVELPPGVPDDVVQHVNELLEKVSPRLRFQA